MATLKIYWFAFRLVESVVSTHHKSLIESERYSDTHKKQVHKQTEKTEMMIMIISS